MSLADYIFVGICGGSKDGGRGSASRWRAESGSENFYAWRRIKISLTDPRWSKKNTEHDAEHWTTMFFETTRWEGVGKREFSRGGRYGKTVGFPDACVHTYRANWIMCLRKSFTDEPTLSSIRGKAACSCRPG